MERTLTIFGKQSGLYLVALLVFVLYSTSLAGDYDSGYMHEGLLTGETAWPDGTYSFRFQLYDHPLEGRPIGPVIDKQDIVLKNGRFWAELDFEQDLYDDKNYWLEVSILLESTPEPKYVIIGDRQKCPDYPLIEFPRDSVNIKLDNLVSLKLINRIAKRKATELWGKVQAGEPMPCCDENGDIIAYMCPFQIGQESFSSYGRILNQVKHGRRQVESVKTSYAKQKKSDSEINADVTNFQKAYKEAKQKEIGAGDYGTVYVSARYDRYPIPLCSHYLPPYYYNADKALEKAADFLDCDEPLLNRYYFLGMAGQYFEFVHKDKKVYIHAQSLEVCELMLPLHPAQQEAWDEDVRKNIQQDIKKEWKNREEEFNNGISQ